ncbi:hypothetical protein IF188_09595 [Microbacterium sp. NEAU-LLC]|uniref:Peptidase S74 domain-containing protein n=1 Tax=Microbacterium helvum TaxID=2773713 RepID=A0ABR8NQB0_9MICO|nr:hypothetical protein [Microbacterium helvum]MBD3941947.1 hypothetical protein [Microbacterium helvum]
MPDTPYTGKEGDTALANGMAVMDGTEDWRDGWRSINKTRDYIVTMFNTLIAKVWPLGISKGGTGATTGAAARTNIGAVEDGIGTGLAFYSPGFGRIAFRAPGVSNGSELQLVGTGGSYLPLSGGTLSGNLYLPAATPASSSYTVCYLNGDGRVSKGASSRRYKDEITPVAPEALGDLFPQLHSFVMKDDPSRTVRTGYIAEDLDASPALRPFVVYERVTEVEDVVEDVYDDELDEDGAIVGQTIIGQRVIGQRVVGSHLARDDAGNPIPDAIDDIALMRAQIAQLNERLWAIENGDDHVV